VTTQTFSVTILNDSNPSVTKSLNLALSSPTPVASALGAVHTATLTLVESDPVIQFSIASYAASEPHTPTGTATIVLTRTVNLASAVSAQVTTSMGTAVPGTDYNDVTVPVNFGAGVGVATVQVPLLHNPFHTGNRTVNLTLGSPSSGVALGLKSAILTILDVDPVATFSFSLGAYSVSDPQGSATITVLRSGNTAEGPVSVNYATSDGTAKNGTDYQSSSGTLTFGAGVTTQTFSVTILNDGNPSVTKSLNLALSSPTPVASALGAVHTATLTLVESDPVIQFSAASYVVSELTSVATIVVSRSVNAAPTTVVSYQSHAGTAVVGQNYVADVSGTLTFTPGVVNKSFTIGIKHDTDHTGPVTVNLSLTPSSTFALGANANATLTITDVDIAGSMQFAAPNFAVVEPVSPGVSQAVITVTRTGGAASNVKVNFATSDGTAVSSGPNPDYQAASGTLTFGAGVTSQQFTVLVLDDATAPSGYRTFTITLSSPSLGATIGAQASATVWIADPP
jgi:hypothetical protein